MTQTFLGSVAQLLGIAVLTWTLQLFLRKWIKAKRVAHTLPSYPPGRAFTLLHPFRPLAFFVGSFFPFKDQIGWMYAKFSLYKKYGSTCLTSTTFWDAIPTYWFADADAIQAVCSDGSTYTKDLGAYDTVNMFGPNMITQEGAEWKRHRAIVKSAFNETNNAFVWEETVRIVNEWFIELDKAASLSDSEGLPTNVDLCHDFTRVTLLVIASAGFGKRSTWTEENSIPPYGRKVHLSRAIMDAVDVVFLRALVPEVLWKAVAKEGMYVPCLGHILLRVRDSFNEFEGHMIELVSQARDTFGLDTRKEDSNVQGSALLKNMVQANMTFEKDEQMGHRNLTDEELLSNMFFTFLAGHETSAHTLCFAFVYLALHPQCQQKVFEESLRIFPSGVPTVSPPDGYKDNVPQLVFTSAVIHETLRLVPPILRLGKIAQKDMVLKARQFSTSPDGHISNIQSVKVPIPKGGTCILDVVGVHMNPIHWGDDVDEFKPERFFDTETYKWPREAFFAFSAGPRACIGQRFAMAESLCILVCIVRRYIILPPTDVLGLDVEKQEEILTRWKPGVTVIPTNARVRFKRRAS